MRVFSKKQTSIFYPGQKASHKKTRGLPTFRFSSISPSESISLITQRVFIAETCAWVRWKGISLSKIQKIKKPNNNNLKKKIGFDDLKWNHSKCIFLKNLKKLPMNNKCLFHVVCRDC
jgi:hypothetical protein